MAKKQKRSGSRIEPISRPEDRQLDRRINKKREQLRQRYSEIHGKKVDWIEHSYHDGYIDLAVVFTDRKVFSLSYSLHALLEGVELADISTGDSVILRTYYRRQRATTNQWKS